jgi:glycosyltransferase involved in cell wall biosynthesis
MKVLILSQHFWPETFRINEIAQSLRGAGCEVVVLTGQPNYPEGKIFRGYRAFAWGREAWGPGPIYRVPLVPRRDGRSRRLVVNYLSFLASASLLGPWLLRGQRFDVIFVYGTSPILQAIAGLVLRVVNGGRLVAWVQDLWPQSLEVTGHVRSPRLLAAVGRLVSWLYRRCDLLLVQSPGFLPLVESMAGSTPVEVHPNPGELSFAQPINGAPALRLDEGFNIVFAGNLGTVQALHTILAAARQLQELSDVRFVIVGSGSRGEWLREQVQRLALTNVQLPGRFPADAMPGLLAQASALLVTLTSSPALAQTVPSKVQAYLAAGRPIIASLDGEGARVVREAGAGLACPAEDADALAAAVRLLRGLAPAELDRMGEAGKRYYAQEFDPDLLARRLVDRFAQLASHDPAETKPRP